MRVRRQTESRKARKQPPSGTALQRLLRLPLRWPGTAAFGLGALSVTAFAPFNLFLLPLLTLALLFRLWLDTAPRRALLIGWSFGCGFMGFGVFWLRISIDQFGNVGTPLAIAAALLFAVFLAIFFGGAGWLGRAVGGGRGVQLLLAFPAAWGLMEWLRGWLLTGFPWLALGYSQVDSPLAGYAPLLGVYGSGWLLGLSAALLVLLLAARRRRAWATVAGVMIWSGGGLLQQQQWTRPAGDPLAVSLVQANIPQSMKWETAMRRTSLNKYARLTRAHWDSDLVIWPETAVPDFLHRVEEDFLLPLADEAARHGTRLLVGVPILDRETGRYYNGARVVGRPGDVYYKRHLVPFGEFLPFEALLRPLLAFMEIPMSNFSAGRERRPIVHVGATPVGVSICYEDAFGREVRQALPEAAYLVNLSNDAWFGDSLAPHQHLQIARMRALETGRPLLRATNTGISALIGPRGGIIAATGAFEEAVLSGRIQPMGGATPFVRMGNGSAVGLMLAALGLALFLGRRHRARG